MCACVKIRGAIARRCCSERAWECNVRWYGRTGPGPYFEAGFQRNGETPSASYAIPGASPFEWMVDAWTHIVFRTTVNGASSLADLFINGVKEVNSTVTINATAGTVLSENWTIGGHPTPAAAERTFKGRLDEIYVWDTTLSDDAIGYLYNSGSGKFYS